MTVPIVNIDFNGTGCGWNWNGPLGQASVERPRNCISPYDLAKSAPTIGLESLMRRVLIVFAALSAATSTAGAYCSEPSAPSCATRYGSFDDEFEFDRCRRQMTSYQSEVEQFVECQNNAIRTARDASEEAVQSYKNAVESFNRRARN